MSSYLDIGKILRQARQDRQLTIAEVARALNVRSRYIVALEDGAIDQMPGLTYTRGYLKRYAALLKLDWPEMQRRFELASEHTPQPALFMPHHFSREKRLPPLLGLMIAALGMGVMAAWLVWGQPDRQVVSVVEPVPEKVMEAPKPIISPATLRLVACLRPSERLYPPCIWPDSRPQPSLMKTLAP